MSDEIKPEASLDDLERLDLRVGKIISVEDFPEAKKPAWLLSIDLGSLGVKRSSAQGVQLRAQQPTPVRVVDHATSWKGSISMREAVRAP